MSPVPTAVRPADARDELTFIRTFRAPIDVVWASITESERTALWFCSWSGEAGPGRTIRYRLEHEEGRPEGEMLIEVCEPPVRLFVSSSDEYGSWRLEGRLAESDGVTELVFVHHLSTDIPIGEVGPGWEYYLDMLVASRDGGPTPDFDDYYPAQKAYFEGL